jgi:AraC-like DNA-binding protein
MSRTQLNRKLRALTGQSTRQFIRNLRLQRAATLLDARWGNVTEVAYEVGFSSLSNFAKAFRSQYHVSPSEYSAKSTQTSPCQKKVT